MLKLRLQKKMKNNVLILLTALLCSVTLFTGCEKKSDAEITFSWWGNAPRHSYTEEGVSLFMQRNPDIKIQTAYTGWSNRNGIQSFPEINPAIGTAENYLYWKSYEEVYSYLISNNLETDVMLINFDWLSKYSPDGLGYYDLNKLSDYIEFNHFTEEDLKYGEMGPDGAKKLNAIPTAFNALVSIYDKTAYKSYGLKVPETWEDLFAAAKLTKKDNIYPLGIGRKHMYLLLCSYFQQQTGKKVFNDDGSFNLNKDEIAIMLSFYKRLLDEKVVYPDINNFSVDSFEDKNIIGAIAWCSESTKYANCFNYWGGEAVLGEYITSKDAKETGWYLKPATMYAIKKDTKNPEACGKFLNFLLNDEDMAKLQGNEKGIPASNKALTVLMENGMLNALEYEALMKIRYNQGAINTMIPSMENRENIDNFFLYAGAYAAKRLSLDDACDGIVSHFE